MIGTNDRLRKELAEARGQLRKLANAFESDDDLPESVRKALSSTAIKMNDLMENE
jgi:chromosomal replication initiator protein